MLTTLNWKSYGVASLALLTAAVTVALNLDAPLPDDADLLTWVELTLSLAGTAALAVTAFYLAAAKGAPTAALPFDVAPKFDPATHIRLPRPAPEFDTSTVIYHHFVKLEQFDLAAEAYSLQPSESNRLAFVDAAGEVEAAAIYLSSHLLQANPLEALRAARGHTARVEDFLGRYADALSD